MAKFSYVNKSGTQSTFDAADSGAALKMLKGFQDANPTSGIIAAPDTPPGPLAPAPTPVPAAPSAPGVTDPTNPAPKPMPDPSTLAPTPLTGGTPPKPVISTSDEATAKEAAALRQQLAPASQYPAPPNLVETYKTLRSANDANGENIDTWQGKVVDLMGKKADAINELNKFKHDVPEGVAEDYATGKISKASQIAQDKVDAIDREINTYNLQIQNRTNTLSTIMTLTGQDYQNASANYTRQFTENLSVYNALNLKGYRAAAEDNRVQDNARANLSIIASQVGKNGYDYDKLPEDQKASIKALELQANLPPGFISNIKSTNPKSDIVAVTDRTDEKNNRYADIVMRDPDTGAITVQHQYLGGQKSTSNGPSGNVNSGSLVVPKTKISQGEQMLDGSRGQDNYADTGTYLGLFEDWTNSGGLPQDFYKQFPPKKYLNPKDTAIPAFIKSELPSAKSPVILK